MESEQSVKKPARGLSRVISTLVVALAGAAVVVPLVAMAVPGGPEMTCGHRGGPFAGRMLDRMLDEVSATDAQRTQIKQIAEIAQADMKAQFEAGRALRDKGLALMAAPTLDAVAAESLRQQMLAQHDQASRRMLQVMLDIGRVLTPEQRAKLAEQMKQHRGMMPPGMDPMGGPRS